MPMRVTVLDDYQQVAKGIGDWSTIPGGVELTTLDRHISDCSGLAEVLAGEQVVVAMRERTAIDAALLDRLPDLELIVTTGPFNAAIDVAAAADRGVTVCGTGGSITPTVELTWALILAAARHIPAEDRAMHAGGWQHTLGVELAGATLGIVGLGRIGSLVTQVGLAFGMDVIAWSENLTAERAAELGARRVDRDELFSTADVVSIHLLLSARTRGLVGEKELRSMKPTALLINTSRGPIVDEAALVRALDEQWIAGAGLDVYDVEPLPPGHRLRTIDRAVLTPHIGYVTDGLYRQFFAEIVEDIAAYRAGSPVRVIAP